MACTLRHHFQLPVPFRSVSVADSLNRPGARASTNGAHEGRMKREAMLLLVYRAAAEMRGRHGTWGCRCPPRRRARVGGWQLRLRRCHSRGAPSGCHASPLLTCGRPWPPSAWGSSPAAHHTMAERLQHHNMLPASPDAPSSTSYTPASRCADCGSTDRSTQTHAGWAGTPACPHTPAPRPLQLVHT